MMDLRVKNPLPLTNLINPFVYLYKHVCLFVSANKLTHIYIRVQMSVYMLQMQISV